MLYLIPKDMSEFIGREHELEDLENHYRSGKFEFVVIYGRRRVGKTSLIQEFVKDKKNIFFTAFQATATRLVEAMGKMIGNATNDFDVILDEIVKISSDERLVLVIDEFPLLAESDPAVLGQLQACIDHRLKNTQLFLILCGSSMSFMLAHVLGGQSPLYGRRTLQMQISPMDYYESARFLLGRAPQECMEIYGVTGGIPMYLQEFGSVGDVYDKIYNLFYKRNALLNSEPMSLIMQEVKAPQRFNVVIEAVADGYSRVSEVSLKTGLDSGEVSRILGALIDLGIISKKSPVDEKNSKKTKYVLCDHLFKFYYANVYGEELSVQQLSDSDARAYIAGIMSDYMGPIFEDISGEYIRRFLGYPNIGTWWGSDPNTGTSEEIDIVATRRTVNKQTEALFAECKMRNSPADLDDLRRLQRRADLVRGFSGRRFAIFSKSGFTDRLISRAKLEDVMLVSMDDMFSE